MGRHNTIRHNEAIRIRNELTAIDTGSVNSSLNSIDIPGGGSWTAGTQVRLIARNNELKGDLGKLQGAISGAISEATRIIKEEEENLRLDNLVAQLDSLNNNNDSSSGISTNKSITGAVKSTGIARSLIQKGTRF